MASSPKVRARLDARIADLCGRFAECLARFDQTKLFTGPSLYFHRKAVARRSAHTSIVELVNDAAFMDALYATLTSWGMHRMGPGNTKLLDLDVIRTSLMAQADAIQALDTRLLGGGPEPESRQLAQAVWRVVKSLKVSVAEARIVANSKALHHVLPNLIPPIDREYTFRFFYGRNMLSIDEGEAFEEMFVGLDRIGRRCAGEAAVYLGQGWHTGHAKVIDNAIVGYMNLVAGATVAPKHGAEPE